jgi:hypothetical protein
MRPVKISIGAKPLRDQRTWAYPQGKALGDFLIPVYDCLVEGTDAGGKSVQERFDVLRFGVKCDDGKTASVVGLADQQSHTIKAWIPTYKVHSASSAEDGAWQVYDNFLIHDGPDNASDLFATVGCIEVIGPRAFIQFNDLVIALSGATGADKNAQLKQIADSGKLSITYAKASRPPLKKGP